MVFAPAQGPAQAAGIFALNETEIVTIQTAYASGGELAAAVELRRLFPGLSDIAQVRRCAVATAGWTGPAQPSEKG